LQNLTFLNKINFLKISILISPIILTMLFSPFSIIHNYPNPGILSENGYSYDIVSKEDKLFETLQSFFLLATSIFFILISILFFKSDKKTLFIFYLIFGLIFFIGFGEEISWGQRILQYDTPEIMRNLGADEQSDLHHIIWIKRIVEGWLWGIIGVYGSFAWLFLHTRKNFSYNSSVRYFIPEWYLAIFFIPSFLRGLMFLFDQNNFQRIAYLIREAVFRISPLRLAISLSLIVSFSSVQSNCFPDKSSFIIFSTIRDSISITLNCP